MQGLKALFAPRDLTQGSPMKGLVLFAIPLLIGNLAQQLYNTVDAIVVGQYISDNALGAVGLTGPIVNLLLVFFMGISTGASIVVSQYFGARVRLDLSRAVGTTIMLTLWSSLAITVIGVFASRPLLLLLNTPPEMLDMAADYLIILFAGILGCAFFNIISGVLRGLGDSVSSLLYLLFATALNIVLDILFVTTFQMGTAGVALATIIAQAVSAVLCFLRLNRMKDLLDVNRQTLRLDRSNLNRIVKLGLPAGLTQMVFSLSSVLVQSLTNSFGTNVVTAVTALMRVDGFAMMPNFTFGIAATTFAGQNIGAKRMDRVQQGAKAGLILSIACSTFLTLTIMLFGESLMRVFTETEEIVEIGFGMFRMLAVGYVAFGVSQTLLGVMRGAGETVKPMWISIFTSVVVRMPIAYLWAWLTKSPEQPNGDWVSLYGSLLIAWIVGCATTLLVYRRGTWKKKCGFDEQKPA